MVMETTHTKNHRHLYFTLFIQTFTLSAFTIGGGYVIVPLMRKAFVEKLGWIEEQEMLDMIAIAQSRVPWLPFLVLFSLL
jgi:chromate transporter